jgi:hypothetical protein
MVRIAQQAPVAPFPLVPDECTVSLIGCHTRKVHPKKRTFHAKADQEPQSLILQCLKRNERIRGVVQHHPLRSNLVNFDKIVDRARCSPTCNPASQARSPDFSGGDSIQHLGLAHLLVPLYMMGVTLSRTLIQPEFLDPPPQRLVAHPEGLSGLAPIPLKPLQCV